MARIRTIKPEFWSSEQVMDVPRDARLAFIGLWNFCDDGGNHIASARTLKAEVFPGDDDLPAAVVEELVADLLRAGLIERYEIDGKAYWHVTGWHHQKIDQPTFRHPQRDGTIPDGAPKRAQKAREVTRKHSQESDDVTAKHPGGSDCVSPPEGKGREGSRIKDMQTTSARETSEDVPPMPECEDLDSPPSPRCPYDQIVALYHETLPTLPRVVKRTPSRDSHVRARFREILRDHAETPAEALLQFGHYFRRVAESRFLTGRAPPGPGRDKPFVADFDWLMHPHNFLKVIEGKYERTRP